MLREARRKLKFKALARRLGSEVLAVGTLEMLWHATAESAPDGGIGRYQDADLEAELGWTGETGALIEALVETGWLDRIDGEARLYVHGWHEHADKTTHRKIARAKGFFANGAQPLLSHMEKDEREKFAKQYEDSPRTVPGQDAVPLQGQGQEQARSKPGALSPAAPAAERAPQEPIEPPPRKAKAPPPDWSLRLATLLHELAAERKRGKVPTPSTIETSARQLALMARESAELVALDIAEAEQRIEAAIRWLDQRERASTPFTPEAYCGATLRKKWTQISNAAAREVQEQRDPMEEMHAWAAQYSQKH